MNAVLNNEEIEELIQMTKPESNYHFDESKLSLKERITLAEWNSIALVNLANNYLDAKK